MIINTNMASLNAQRNLSTSSLAMQKSLQKLSSGFRINSASDDAAGLAISEKLRGQVRGSQQAQRNAQDGISLLQTAEGALNETHSILQRMRELAVQASNGTLVAEDHAAVTTEMNELSNEIDRIGNSTQFNTTQLLDGSFTAVDLQIGPNDATDTNQKLTIQIAQMDATGLGVDTGNIDTSTTAAATVTIQTIDDAINSVSSQRSSIGAWQNRLDHTINNLSIGAENMTAAESRIRDVDMAKEMSTFTKNQILNQASIAMLAQANQAPQSILKLLG